MMLPYKKDSTSLEAYSNDDKKNPNFMPWFIDKQNDAK